MESEFCLPFSDRERSHREFVVTAGFATKHSSESTHASLELVKLNTDCAILDRRLQPNLDTRQKQLDAWAALVLSYHKHRRSYTLDVVESQASPLFHNKSINRILHVQPTRLLAVRLLFVSDYLHPPSALCCHIYAKESKEARSRTYIYVVECTNVFEHIAAVETSKRSS